MGQELSPGIPRNVRLKDPVKGKNEHKEARKGCNEQSHRVNVRNDYQDFKCFGQKWSLENEKIT